MMECSSLRQPCKETFNLYYYPSEADDATLTSPAWMENPYIKVATVAADHLMLRDARGRPNVKVLRLEGLRKAGLYLAFQSQSACMALLSVRVFYRKCPPLRRAFASFPETVPHSLVEQVTIATVESSVLVHNKLTFEFKNKSTVTEAFVSTSFYFDILLQAQGVCVENAVTPPGEQSQPPSMLCGEDGEWVGQPTSSCACRPGYEAGETDVRCRGESAVHKTKDLLLVFKVKASSLRWNE